MKPPSHGITIVVNTFNGHCLLQKKRGLFSMSVMQSFLIPNTQGFILGCTRLARPCSDFHALAMGRGGEIRSGEGKY